MSTPKELEQRIAESIRIIRNQKVILDADIAAFYRTETRVLNQAVKRNLDRFPDDFMFQLSKDEWEHLKSQSVTSSWGGRRTPPFAFTEQGVAMLSSVLNSKEAIAVNIAIMRVFVQIRQWSIHYDELKLRLNEIEFTQGDHSARIAQLYTLIEELLKPQLSERRPIGFNRKPS